jgi:hypothetical protein
MSTGILVVAIAITIVASYDLYRSKKRKENH